MQDRFEPKKIIIVGAGISGATAANELAKTLDIPEENITLLESKGRVGGMLESIQHDQYPEITAEGGAGVAAINYKPLKVMAEKNIQLEKLLPVKLDTVQFYNDLMSKSLFGKMTYIADYLWQNVKFAKHVWQYNRAIAQEAPHPPVGQTLPFAAFAQKHHLDKFATNLDWLGPKFGYGPLSDANNYAYRYCNYMGYLTMFTASLPGGLAGIHGGYQQLVEKMLQGFDVRTSANITRIDRNEHGVYVTYEQEGKQFNLYGDMLVLATSPYHWEKLNMPLSPEEKECVDKLTYYPYPVAIVKVKGLKPENLFFLDEKDKNNYGRPAFLFTKDNRQNIPDDDGRFCTVYINLPQGKTDFSLDENSPGRKTLVDTLLNIPGVTDVKIENTHIWPDYNPCVPYETGMKLRQTELKDSLRTVHVSTCFPGSFGTVRDAYDYAETRVRELFGQPKSVLQKTFEATKNAWQFFTLPRKKPVDEAVIAMNESLRRDYPGPR